MPNRYVREAAIESESVNALSWQAEVFYRRLLNRADDFGRFTANQELLRAKLFPLQLAKVNAADAGRLLKQCEDVGLVFTYSVSGKPYLVINRWERGRAKTSQYPEPPSAVLERMQTYVYTRKHMSAHAPDSDSDTDSVRGGAATPRARPEMDQWLTYAKEIQWPDDDARSAFDHYQANGWKVGGKTPVKDWQAAARNCQRRSKTQGKIASNANDVGRNSRSFEQRNDYSALGV